MSENNISTGKRCLIIAGAPECYFPISFKKADFVIACDAGYVHAMHAKIKPDLLVSDFDSFSGPIDASVEILSAPSQKDESDTMIALKEAIRRGYSDIMIAGATGGRIDHMYANLQLLSFAAKNGVICYIVDAHHQIFAISDSSVRVSHGQWKWLSVFAPAGDAKGVTLKGLKYELDDAVLSAANPMGVSNEFVSEEVVISVKQGILLIMLSDLQ